MFNTFGYPRAVRHRFDGNLMDLLIRLIASIFDERGDSRTSEQPQVGLKFLESKAIAFPRLSEVKSQLRRMQSWASRRKAEIEKGASICKI